MGCVPSSENNFLRCLRIQLIEIAYEAVFFFLFVFKMWKYWRWSTKVLIVYSNGGESKWKLKAKVTNKHDSQEKKRNTNEIQTDYCNSLFISNIKNEKLLSRQRFHSSFEWMCHIKPTWHKTIQHTLQTLIEIYLFIVQTNPWRKRCFFLSHIQSLWRRHSKKQQQHSNRQYHHT